MKKRTVVIAVVVLIGITACVMGVLIHSEAQKRAMYEQAMRLADAGDTGGAYVLFTQLGNYQDAALQAERLIELDVLLPCRAAEKGDTVTFGRYEQDNNLTNGREKIEWLIAMAVMLTTTYEVIRAALGMLDLRLINGIVTYLNLLLI